MKKMKNLSDRYRYLVSFFTLPAVMILVLVSCTGKPEPYIILEVSGSDNITNYSKSSLFVNNITDSINPTPIAGSQGDLFLSGDNIFVFDDTSSKGSFELKTDDFVFYVNDMISSISIP
jgi:hypothetical protein